MTEDNIRKLYENEINSSAPDMDALWAKIEESLPEKNKEEINTAEKSAAAAKKKPFITLKKGFAFMAACAVLAVVIPTARSNLTKHGEIANSAEITNNESFAENNGGFADNAGNGTLPAAADHYDGERYEESYVINEVKDILSYEGLDLFPAEKEGISFTGTPNGSEYFSESDIFVETDCFIDARVTDVFASADESCVYYVLEAKTVYSKEGEDESGRTVTVSSASPYEMLAGREYLIPVKGSENGFETVYDRVPQIEITSSGGVVYYNGWKSLDSELSQDILYPQSGIDDFFYDRMKFSYSGYKDLIDKWRKTIQS